MVAGNPSVVNSTYIPQQAFICSARFVQRYLELLIAPNIASNIASGMASAATFYWQRTVWATSTASAWVTGMDLTTVGEPVGLCGEAWACAAAT